MSGLADRIREQSDDGARRFTGAAFSLLPPRIRRAIQEDITEVFIAHAALILRTVADDGAGGRIDPPAAKGLRWLANELELARPEPGEPPGVVSTPNGGTASGHDGTARKGQDVGDE